MKASAGESKGTPMTNTICVYYESHVNQKQGIKIVNMLSKSLKGSNDTITMEPVPFIIKYLPETGKKNKKKKPVK